eukprot:4251224-Pleurochrysis_carterae.AAC.1
MRVGTEGQKSETGEGMWVGECGEEVSARACVRACSILCARVRAYVWVCGAGRVRALVRRRVRFACAQCGMRRRRRSGARARGAAGRPRGTSRRRRRPPRPGPCRR